MKKPQNINSFSQLANWSEKSEKPLFILLENENHSRLMAEVVEDLETTDPSLFQLIKIKGKDAEAIQFEVSFSKLPALLIFSKGKLVALYQGLVAKHEIIKFLSKKS